MSYIDVKKFLTKIPFDFITNYHYNGPGVHVSITH